MVLKFWEQLWQAENIFQSLRPLTYISLLGLAPFSVTSLKEVRTSALAFIAGVVHFIYYVLCLFLSSIQKESSIISYFFQTYLTRFSEYTLTLTGIIVMLTIFIFAIIKRKALTQIIQSNLVVDEIFYGLDMKLDYGKVLWYSFVISLGMLVFNVIYLCMSYMLLRSADIKPSFCVFTTFALPHINISIMVFKFLCTTHLAKSRFCMMNAVLQDILDSHIEERNASELSPMHSMMRRNRGSAPRRRASFTPNQHQHRRRPVATVLQTNTPRYSVVSIIRQNPEYAVKQVANVHNLLCDICNTIEEYFTWPLLAIIAISFLFIVFDDFYILEAMLHPSRVESADSEEFFAFFFAQMSWYAIIIFFIVEGSGTCIKESAKSAAIVHKILNITDDAETRERLFRLSLQLSHRRVCFTAAGLFNLDRTLIFTISGAATCYLIILIQFRTVHQDHQDDTFGNSSSLNAIVLANISSLMRKLVTTTPRSPIHLVS